MGSVDHATGSTDETQPPRNPGRHRGLARRQRITVLEKSFAPELSHSTKISMENLPISKHHFMYCKQSIFSQFLLSAWHTHSAGRFLYWTIYFLVFLIKFPSPHHYVSSLMQGRCFSLNIPETRIVGFCLIRSSVELMKYLLCCSIPHTCPM